MTAGKTIALTRQTFVDKVMSLLFNILLRKCQPTPVFLPGESHGQRSLVGYSPRGYKESDMTERFHFFTSLLGFHSFSCKEPASFNFMTVVSIHNDFGASKNKVWHSFHVSPSICHGVMGVDAKILVFWMMSFKPAFYTLLFHFHQEAL